MPQIQLPFFPEGVTQISDLLAFRVEDGRVTYFNGNMPVSVHDRGDIATFRMITAQFCVNGNAKQAEISAVFGIPTVTVKQCGGADPGGDGQGAGAAGRGAGGGGRGAADGTEARHCPKAVRAGRLHKPSKKKT